jgi:ribokinase
LIIVFGSIGLDIVQTVCHLPRPGETVLTANYVMLPGGKGANQALAAARAGGEVCFSASIGDDDFGQRALSNLAEAGVDLSAVARRSRPTACATISVDGDGENQIVVSSGANLETTAAQLKAAPGDLVLQQMEIPLSEICAGVDLAQQQGAQIILNAAPFHPIPPAILAKLDILIVNEVEARMLADDLGLGPVESLRGGATALCHDGHPDPGCERRHGVCPRSNPASGHSVVAGFGYRWRRRRFCRRLRRGHGK